VDTPTNEPSPPPVTPSPRPLLYNTLSWIGLAFAVIGGVLILLIAVTDIRAGNVNPYVGVVGYVLGPILLILGLIFIPLGALLRSRKLARTRLPGGQAPAVFPVFDLNQPSFRKTVLLFGVATAVVVAIMVTAGVKGEEFGDSAAFCGLTCHTVMTPEWNTYQASSHAKVQCTRCHIGPGASWFVQSKLSGTYQVIAYTLNTYPRPIPSPIESLRPSRDTCEVCHWPERVYGDRLNVSETFASDAANTPSQTQLLFRVGGGLAHSGGIHWHIANQVWYLPQDNTREQITWLSVKNSDGTSTEYVDPSIGKRPSQADVNARARQLDCIDCHNRSAHDIVPFESGVDRALAEGRLDSTLPFLKKKALELGPQNSQQPYAEDRGQVLSRIATLSAYYQKEYPAVATAKQASIDKAVQELSTIYEQSAFQEMKADSTTYVNNLTHDGCFRCHGVLVAADGPRAGQPIASGCTTCHYEPTASASGN
jgi:NapC/NirT cytochrome c family, N-terminal region